MSLGMFFFTWLDIGQLLESQQAFGCNFAEKGEFLAKMVFCAVTPGPVQIMFWQPQVIQMFQHLELFILYSL